jgi:D-sedoheptulose 7-phosphate isomerase
MANRTESGHAFLQAIQDHIKAVGQLEKQEEVFEQIADRMIRAICGGNRILWCGNGGSAADSQYLAAEIVGRFRRERRGSAFIALTTELSILTVVANDYGYDAVFARQVEAICKPGDVVVGLTTSGRNPNVCEAVQCAHALGAFTVGMTGEGGGKLATLADVCLRVASCETARIQECHNPVWPHAVRSDRVGGFGRKCLTLSGVADDVPGQLSSTHREDRWKSLEARC